MTACTFRIGTQRLPSPRPQVQRPSRRNHRPRHRKCAPTRRFPRYRVEATKCRFRLHLWNRSTQRLRVYRRQVWRRTSGHQSQHRQWCAPTRRFQRYRVEATKCQHRLEPNESTPRQRGRRPQKPQQSGPHPNPLPPKVRSQVTLPAPSKSKPQRSELPAPWDVVHPAPTIPPFES